MKRTTRPLITDFLLLPQCPDPLDEFRNDLEQITDNAVMSNFENRRFLIAINGDDQIRILHPDQMLDGAAYTAGYVDLGTHCFTCLANLSIMGHPPGINSASGRSNHATEFICKFLQQGKLVTTHHPTDPVYNNLSYNNKNMIQALLILDELKDFC